MPKKFSYNDTFEKYITSFLQNFSVDDQGKFDLLAFKNSKYLFYRFNDFLKIYGNPRYKLLHTRKMVDSKALEKLENKNKQFMIEKIIQGVEFENASQSNPEKNPEIKTIESNYRIARRIYEQLFLNIAELFHGYIQSIDFYEQQEIEEDMKINGWGTVENIRTIKDSMRLLNLFQNFYYTATGRLPTFNELLVVPDGDAQPEEKINLKQLYTACFKIQTPTLLFLYHFWDFYRWKKFASCQKCHNRIR